MRQWIRDIGTAFLMGVVVPAVMLRLGTVFLPEPEEPREVQETQVSETVETEASQQTQWILLRQEDGTVELVQLEEYLVGAVLGEMPASFETEALKAQAVAARTYAARAYETGGKHGDGSVCTNYACCQAYLTEEVYRNRGGSAESVAKVRSAVLATSGQVLTYEGALIEATYFSCSGGVTEDAVAVWGTDVPYLRSVESPGEEGASVYTDSKTFTPEEFQAALGIQLSGSPEEWFGAVTYTNGQGVDTLSIGRTPWSGTKLRQKLGLRSTMFWVEVQANSICFHTRGYGHRVGMSQYGADAMARSGADYTQILGHYYPSSSLESWVRE